MSFFPGKEKNVMIKDYFLQNWTLILLLIAFAVLLKTTVFLEKKIKGRLYVLAGSLFLLSLSVFLEFYFEETGSMQALRIILMAVRYSATPIIVAMVLYTLVKRAHWKIFIPTAILAAVNIISISTGIVFSLNENGDLVRGPLGYLPYIGVGGYCFFLVFILFRQSNKQATEIIPILFLCFAFISGLILPFVLGKDYSKIFCSTIVVAVFVYYVFSILQLTTKDALTGLLNRQAYYAATTGDPKDITALVSIDMNGLKAINDSGGHAAGDEALVTLALCFLKSVKGGQSVYRVGGDEFVIICRRSSEEEVQQLIERIEKNVSATIYSCAIGYSYSPEGGKPLEEMLKESDEMMYARKAQHYLETGKERR